ncbi:MAG: hypothetical protein NT029_13650 [Armatimonadetes bacterium]|nr:hypothetical protein [Armatimonadota bacterium]
MRRRAALVVLVAAWLASSAVGQSAPAIRWLSGSAPQRLGRPLAVRHGLELRAGDTLVGPARFEARGLFTVRMGAGGKASALSAKADAAPSLRVAAGTVVLRVTAGRLAVALPGHTLSAQTAAFSATVTGKAARVTCAEGKVAVALAQGSARPTMVGRGETLLLEEPDALPWAGRAATDTEWRVAAGAQEPPAGSASGEEREPGAAPSDPGSDAEVARIRNATGMAVTKHFVQRLGDRDITANDVIDVVQHGRLYYDPLHNNTVRWKGGIYVAIGNDNVLITAIRGSVPRRWVPR